MLKQALFANKLLQRKQQERVLETHMEHLMEARPVTSSFGITPFPNRIINQGKKRMMNEIRFTEIERQNRMLLQKITSIMRKKSQTHGFDTKTRCSTGFHRPIRQQKSLNGSYRRKQFQRIELQNAKMLKRLQQKRSDYELGRFKKQWRKSRQTIQNITSYPLDSMERRRKSMSISRNGRSPEEIELTQNIEIDGVPFEVNVKLCRAGLSIRADNPKERELKVIEVDEEQALEFIREECYGQLANIFKLLEYVQSEKTLYLRRRADLYEQQQNELEEKQKKAIKEPPSKQLSNTPRIKFDPGDNFQF